MANAVTELARRFSMRSIDLESLAREFDCDNLDCRAKAGKPCVNIHGVEKQISHNSRYNQVATQLENKRGEAAKAEAKGRTVPGLNRLRQEAETKAEPEPKPAATSDEFAAAMPKLSDDREYRMRSVHGSLMILVRVAGVPAAFQLVTKWIVDNDLDLPGKSAYDQNIDQSLWL